MSTLRSDVAAYDVEAVRRDFPFFETGAAYLDSTSTSLRPRQVLEAMQAYYERFNANVHRGVYKASMEASEGYEAARRKVRGLINAASSKEIIYTRNTTEAINLVAATWGRANIREGDLIVLTVMEHHSNLVPWQVLAQEKGARIEYVDIDDGGVLQLDQFYKLLERGPKLVAFAQVSNALGTINPYLEMTAAAKAAGATVLIDGAQGVPHLGVDVRATGCDFFAFSPHKMCGPTGTGILYGRRELLESMPPYQTGGGEIRAVYLDHTEFAELPDKFEAGTPAIAEAIGLGAAVDYVQAIGADAIHAHEVALVDYAFEALSEIEGLRILSPPPPHQAGVLSLDLAGVHPHDVGTILDRHDVYVRTGHHCAMPLMNRLDVAATSRASFYLYTTFEEIDRLAAGLQDVKRIFD